MANFFDQFDAVPAQSAPQAGSNFFDQFDDAPPPAAQQPDRSVVPAAIADVPKEIGAAFASGAQHLTGDSISDMPGFDPRTRGQLGPVEGLMRTGRQILGAPEMLVSPIVGAARSLIGHPMADATHAVGELIAPEVAAKDDPAKMYEAAKGDVDLALAGARAGVPKGPTLKAPTINELKAASDAAYSSPEVLGLEVKPTTLRNYSTQTRMSLNQDGFDDIVAPKTFSLLDRIQNFPQGATVTGQNINTLRKTLGKIAGGNDPTEKAAASFAIEHLDDFLPKIGKADVLAGDPSAASAMLAEARGNYAAAKQSEKLDKKIVRAQMQADTSNSGMNLENRIRTAMGKIAVEPREARGLTASEIAMAKEIAEGTKKQNAMRAAGNVMGGGGGIGAFFTGLPTGGAAPAAGFALKLLSNRMTLQQAERLSEAIRMRAPLASSAAKFGQAFAQYQAAKTPSAYAAAVIAARNLSNNLHGSGAEPAISSLVRSMSRPGAHQDE